MRHKRGELAHSTGRLDPEGQLLTTDRWPYIQDEIRRFHPRLQLAFDRENGKWVIVRRDWEPVSLNLARMPGWDGATLSYARPFWTIILELRWSTAHPTRGGAFIHHYREPGPWLMHTLARMEAEQFTHDNMAWAQKRIQQSGIEREKAWQKRTDEIVDGAIANSRGIVWNQANMSVQAPWLDRKSNVPS